MTITNKGGYAMDFTLRDSKRKSKEIAKSGTFTNPNHKTIDLTAFGDEHYIRWPAIINVEAHAHAGHRVRVGQLKYAKNGKTLYLTCEGTTLSIHCS